MWIQAPLGKVDLTLEEQEPITISKKKKTQQLFTANGTIRTTEQATVHVKDLDMLVAVPLLKDSPVLLYLGNSGKNIGVRMNCETCLNGQRNLRKAGWTNIQKHLEVIENILQKHLFRSLSTKPT